jgi:hypothetical protein
MDPNKVLVNAVHAVANARLKAVANTIRQASNANGAKKNQLIQNLQRQLTDARQAAAAAENVAPRIPAAPATQNAEIQAVNAVNKLIKNIMNQKYNNKLKDPFYNAKNLPGYNASRQNNINKVVQTRRITFKPLPPLPPP